MYPLMLTIEHERGEFDPETCIITPEYGHAVIKLNGREIKRIELKYFHEAEERETLEQAAGDWIAKL